MARLIARLWDVTGGSVQIGGADVRQMTLKQLAGQVSFVTQDNFLFDCSLKENIRLGNPKADDEQVLAAARAAQCEEFIGRLEKGWDTPAGEAGKQLSGGERQRIAIARAILKDAPIIILDEATAFTDPDNESKVQSSIMALSGGRRCWSSLTACPPFRTRTRSPCWKRAESSIQDGRRSFSAAAAFTARCGRPTSAPGNGP